jgi:hypothetical protein
LRALQTLDQQRYSRQPGLAAPPPSTNDLESGFVVHHLLLPLQQFEC